MNLCTWLALAGWFFIPSESLATRLKQVNDGGQVTSYEYGDNSGGGVFDVSGFKPTQVTDPRGVVTTFVYDDLYRPVTQTVAGFGSTHTTYDGAGNPLTVTDALNRTTEHVYDAFGQVVWDNGEIIRID